MAITKQELEELQRAYSQGNPKVTDEEYDELMEEYVREHGESSRPFLRAQQSSEVNDIVGTLTKAYGVVTPMREGQMTYERLINLKSINKNTRITIQPKFDGHSVSLDCKTGHFFTRGDYDNGESVDVTDLFSPYFNKDFPNDTDAVKFEAIISNEIFDELKPLRDNGEPYKRARDFLGGIMTSRNVELAKYITLVPLRIYTSGVQRVADDLQDISLISAKVDDFDVIEDFIDDKLSDGAIVEYNGAHYAIDGVVISPMDGCDTIPEKEIAIKILNLVQETKIVNIDYQFGKTGKITPVGILEPVKFDTITVDHVTLSTLDRVKSLNLKFGDTVRIVYNIVPYLLDSYHDGTYPIPIPKNCPICGSPLNTLTLKTVRCTNPHCSGLKIGMITRYCEQMKMMGISKGKLSKLFEYGLINCIGDLYRLTPEKIQEVEGFKEKSANKICDAIRSASSNVPLSRWLGALPIKDISAKTWKSIIVASFDNDEFKAANCIRYHITEGSVDTFMEEIIGQYSYGIGFQTVRGIREGLSLYWNDIKDIIDYVSFRIGSDLAKPTRGRVTMTGTRDDKLTSYLIEKGYDVNDFSSKTIALIIPFEGYKSSKVVKAIKNNIPVYTVEEAYERL